MIKYYFMLSCIFLALVAIYANYVFIVGYALSLAAVFLEKWLSVDKDVKKKIENIENKVSKLIVDKGFNDLRRR